MLSEKTWKPEGVVRFVFCLLLCVASVLLIAGLIQQLSGAKPDDHSPLAVIAGTFGLHGSILIAAAIFLRSERISWPEAFGFKTPGLGRALMWGIIVALCFMPIGISLRLLCDKLLQLVHVHTQDQQAVETLKNAAPGFSRVYLVIWAVAIAPVAEETLFRGILYPAIKQLGFPRLALWGTSSLFALIHLDISIFIPLLVFALILATLYEKTNNLLACITAHCVFNAANIVLMYCIGPGDQPPY